MAKKSSASTFLAESGIRSVVISPDGKWIATTHESQHVGLWNAATGKLCWSKRAGGSGMQFVQACAFSPDSSLVVSGATKLKVFDVATGKAVDGPLGHPKGEVVDVAWSAAGILSVSAKTSKGADTTVALWEPSGALIRQWTWALPRQAAFVADALLVLGCNETRDTEVLCRIDPTSGATLATCLVDDYSWLKFAATLDAVWVRETSAIRRYDLSTLEPGAQIGVEEDENLHCGAANELVTACQSRVRRRNGEGEVVAEWQVPEVAGAEEYLVGLRERGIDPEVRLAGMTEVKAVAVSSEGRYVVAAGLALHVFEADGTPVTLASVGA